MRKSLPLLVSVLAIAMIGSSVFAYAPVISPLPDIWIGDMEDNVGTVDNNLFRFSDAFDLDLYVTDEDTTISTLAWSFYEGGAGNLQVNGVTELAAESDAVNASALGKDIRHQAAPFDDSQVDFWDLKDSPLPLSVPYPTPADPLNEVVSFFVTDGAFVDSYDIIVQADDGGFDNASASTSWEKVDEFYFEGTTEGWTFTGPSANAADAAYAGAFSSYNNAALGIRTDNSTSRFGFWSSPDSIPADGDKLFKYVWTVTADATQLNMPTIRFRVNEETFAYTHTMALSSTDPGSDPFMPTSTPRDYNQYVMPITTGAMFPIFDVYDFDSTDQGTASLEQLVVYKADVPATGWTADTVPAFGSWSALTSITPYGAVTSGTSGGLQLTSSVSNGFNYGFWNSAANIAMADNKLYRVLFNIASTATAPPNGMVRVSSQDTQVSYRLSYAPATAPDSDGEVYPLYFETHEYVSGLNGFNLNFEIADFENTLGGTITLTDVVVENHDLIP